MGQLAAAAAMARQEPKSTMPFWSPAAKSEHLPVEVQGLHRPPEGPGAMTWHEAASLRHDGQ